MQKEKILSIRNWLSKHRKTHIVFSIVSFIFYSCILFPLWVLGTIIDSLIRYTKYTGLDILEVVETTRKDLKNIANNIVKLFLNSGSSTG